MDRSLILLLVAVALEVVGTSALKLTAGFTKPLPILVVFLAYSSTFALMSIAMKTIPINIAYAIWSGLGTVSIAVVGYLFFRETLTGWALLGIAMIVGGVVVLQTLGTPPATLPDSEAVPALESAAASDELQHAPRAEVDDGRPLQVEAVPLHVQR